MEMDPVLHEQIRRFARSKYSWHSDYEDILQDALMGAWEAQQRFDPELGWTLITYCSRRAEGAMLDGIRSRNPGTRLYPVKHVELPEEYTGSQRFEGEDQLRYDATVSELYSVCKDERDEALIAGIIEGKSYTDIANEWGVTQAAISVRLRLIRTKLKGLAA